jgi:hypothetical protein
MILIFRKIKKYFPDQAGEDYKGETIQNPKNITCHKGLNHKRLHPGLVRLQIIIVAY